MPAVINAAANLMFGATLALVARRSPALHDSFLCWPLLFLVGFEALVFTPVATYLFRFYPQWSMLYWFDPQIFTNLDAWIGWLSVAAVGINFGAALLGYALGRVGVLFDSMWLATLPVILGALFILSIAVFYGDRVAFIGDYDAFWHGTAAMMFQRTPGWVGAGLYLCTGLFVYWTHNRFSGRDPYLI